jgi:hypothetical protein
VNNYTVNGLITYYNQLHIKTFSDFEIEVFEGVSWLLFSLSMQLFHFIPILLFLLKYMLRYLLCVVSIVYKSLMGLYCLLTLFTANFLH